MNEVQEQKKGMFDNVPPKFTFAFGLVIGIAAFSLFGYFSLLAKVSGTEEVSANANKNTNAGAVAGDSANTNTAVADVKPVSDSDHIRGNVNAALTIVEYSDYECPYCKTYHETVKQILDKYPDDVNFVYRHYPLSFHANAQKEAEAAECVAELGGNDAFWKFTDAIYERTTSNGTGFALDALGPLAKEFGVNQTKFQECLDSDRYAEKVATDMSEGSAAGVEGTPMSFILDQSGTVLQTISGAYPFSTVDSYISSLL